MSGGIDISKKCDKFCQENEDIVVERGFVGDLSEYGYITHKGINEAPIGPIRFGEQPIQTDDGSPQEVTIYYYREYDNDPKTIKKPLFLRAKYRELYHLYEHTSTGDSIKWHDITFAGEIPQIPVGNQTNPQLTKKLKSQACKLYNLHSVNIYKKNTYECACGEAKVTVEPEGSIPGYKTYKHSYSTNANSVKYRSVDLLWKDNDDQPITLDADQTPNLYAYYWDEDTDHRKPLIMEVYVGGTGYAGTPISLGNDGKEGHSEWSMIDLGSVSVETLHEQKCKLFSPLVINVSAKYGESYPNEYCKDRDCKNGSPKDINVTGYDGVKLEGFTAFRHTYGEKGGNNTFAVTGFTNGPGEDLAGFFPIWDVKDVVVFFAKCQKDANGVTKTPLLVYVESDGGKTHRWYRSENGGKWEKEGRLKDKDPREAGILETTLNGIKKRLQLKCPEDIAREKQRAEEERMKKEEQERVQKEREAREKLLGLASTLGEVSGKALGHGLVIAGALGTVGLELAHSLADKVLCTTSAYGKDEGRGSEDRETEEEEENCAEDSGLVNDTGETRVYEEGQQTASQNSPSTSLEEKADDVPSDHTTFQTPLQQPGQAPTVSLPQASAPITLDPQQHADTVSSGQDNSSAQGGPGEQGSGTTQTGAEGSAPPPAPPETNPPLQPEAASDQLTAEPLVAGGLATGLGIWSISGISSGTLTGAGATFFGGFKLYNRYKGDPWVRQI
ncbi:hypothetical protein BEWA_038450 [Theileria equi strain WA]|uniref:Uncharacterized protein n=1 Tax=Theileria equi strain WA TaxID=1537102 RepID=L1LF87_THEEQ|nr:hypothetical protein BEWA_038450 [Theileria equi strain WA]EKX73808.1 hypothetical protein BEWA_038450 [Theileria equi strain WA]|eukprot:XP_004833260.1 hypothetical protein BEWA_038450 [Theileria equi strain WA]